MYWHCFINQAPQHYQTHQQEVDLAGALRTGESFNRETIPRLSTAKERVFATPNLNAIRNVSDCLLWYNWNAMEMFVDSGDWMRGIPGEFLLPCCSENTRCFFLVREVVGINCSCIHFQVMAKVKCFNMGSKKQLIILVLLLCATRMNSCRRYWQIQNANFSAHRNKY